MEFETFSGGGLQGRLRTPKLASRRVSPPFLDHRSAPPQARLIVPLYTLTCGPAFGAKLTHPISSQPLLNPQESQKKGRELALAFAIETLQNELPNAEAELKVGQCLYDTANNPDIHLKAVLATICYPRLATERAILGIADAFSKHIFEILELLQSASHQES